MRLSAPYLLFNFLFLLQFAVGQTQITPPNPNESVDEKQRQNRELSEIENQINRSKNPMTNAGYRRRAKTVLTEKDRESIKIDPDDAAKFAGFLKQPDTGIVRLHDVSLCSENMSILEANAPCPQNIGGKGTAFSFRLEDYRLSVFSDLQFKSKKLDIVGVNILGFLSNLGDVPLEKVDLKTAGIKELAEFEPSTAYKDVVKQQNFARKGFQVGDFFYRSVLTPQLNKTYVLRSIAYKGNFYFQIGQSKMNIGDLDKRKDVIVVFRLVRQYDDGSIVILWKKLWRKTAPVLDKSK
jgi:hypothetical protein